MANKLMDEKQEKEYKKFLLNMINTRYGLLLKEYLPIVNEAFEYMINKKISQPKLSKDFKKLNIKRIKEDNRFVYKEVEPNETEDYPVEFINYVNGKPIKISNLQCLKIPVLKGTENIVCEKIIDEFYGHNIICIPAYQCVCILCKKGKNAEDAEKQDKTNEKINRIRDVLLQIYQK